MKLSDDITKLLISGLMGILGGLITLPLNALLNWTIEKDKIHYEQKLALIAKKQELLLQHRLELERLSRRDEEIAQLKDNITKLEQRLQK